MNLIAERRINIKAGAVIAGIALTITLISTLGVFGGLDSPTREEFVVHAEEFAEHVKEEENINEEQDDNYHDIKEQMRENSNDLKWIIRKLDER